MKQTRDYTLRETIEQEVKDMPNTKKTFDEVYKKCFEFEKKHKGCSQALIAGLQSYMRIDSSVFKGVTALAGGIGLTGSGPCGGFTSGAVVISLVYGRDSQHINDMGRMMKSAAQVRKLEQKYIRQYGSVICNDIQKVIYGRSYNFFDSNDLKELEKMAITKAGCAEVVATASKWVLDILLEKEECDGSRSL